MLREITDLMLSDKVYLSHLPSCLKTNPATTATQLKAPEHEILSINPNMSDEAATQSLREKLGQIAAGRFGKKLLLKFE